MVLDIYLEILKSNPSKASEAPSFNASTTSANGHIPLVYDPVSPHISHFKQIRPLSTLKLK